MSQPFLSEIKICSFNFPPKGWAFCNGQLMPINQNQALFSLLGTTYGGDGRVTFGLPNLQGNVPMHTGNGHTLGERGGQQSHTLLVSELPTHVHSANAQSSSTGAVVLPGGNVLAAGPFWGTAASLTSLIPGTIGNVGGSQPHENMQPYLTLSFCIALVGIFPSQN